jgi:Ion channel
MGRSQQRYGLLLVTLMAAFFFEGVATPGSVQRAIGTVLVGLTLLLALHAAEVSARLMRIALILVSVLVTGVVVATLVGKGDTVEGLTAVANLCMVAVAPPAVVIGVYRNLRATGSVTVTVVAGVLCLYILEGLFFAFFYVAVQNLGGAPFFAGGAAATLPRAVYFSFVTLETVGFGDYTARTNFGHMLSVSEALVGQIYLVTVVAAIVSRLVPRRPLVDHGSRAD